jgi:hypothetical protein
LARATIKEHESECPSCLGLRTWVDWGFTDEEGDEDEDEDKENVDEDIDEEEECEGREGPVANLHDPASHKHNRISDANS